MPGITGLGTTYNLPNYVGELFAVSTEDTPLLPPQKITPDLRKLERG